MIRRMIARRISSPALLLLLILFIPSQRAGAQEVELEQIMSFHFPSNLVASPAGERIAWLGNQEGRRNVWGAEAPEWEARCLTSYIEDDGQELSGLAFLSDGRRLIYLRGGAPNRDGELPNPVSSPAGVSRDLWLVSWNGDEPVRIAGAVSPRVSPVGNRIVWADDGRCVMLDLLPDRSGRSPEESGRQVVVRRDPEQTPPPPPLSTERSRGNPLFMDWEYPPGMEPRILFQVRSDLGDLQWSPDGTMLAFSSARDGRSLLGVFDLGKEELRWITNSVDRDFSPRWSPDGSRLAFLRRPVDHRGYALCIVDVAGSETTELWRSPGDGSGNYPGAIAGSYGLMYGDGYIVFAGEWSGWNHLYVIPDGGGEVRELTPGEGIVENAVLSPDGQWLYVSHNLHAIDFRQLSRIRLADGVMQAIEEGEVIAWNPVMVHNHDWLAYLRSDAFEPASVYLSTSESDAGTRISPLPDGYPLSSLVKPLQVIFEAADGVTIHGQLFVPDGLRRRDRVPAVIFMHGGSRRQMLLGWHNRGYYHNAYGFNQYLAACGYVVLSVNYRSGIGYGVGFREPAEYGYLGASEYQDIVAAGHYLQDLDNVDPDRIGLWGGSYGGYLTALGLARDSDLFKAGVDLHGVHNWADQLEWWGRGDGGGAGQSVADQRMRIAFESSPVAAIDSWRSPVLIVHADDDRNVPFEASIDLVRRLRRKGDVIFEELYFVDDVHGFLLHRNWLEVYRRATAFFGRYLKEGADRNH
ncbi:prolyl oligopeptidase family serine peptidase [Gemmatimonadota bacterium]